MTVDNQQAPQTTETKRGRPRDPDLEDRVYDCVMSLFANGGWSALTFEAVARGAGTGKSSLYRRWQSREALLKDALHARWLPVHKIDTGSLRQDLRALAEMIFTNRTGNHSNIEQWFLIDGARYPEVRTVTAPFTEQTVHEARAISRRAAKRGEIPETVNSGLLLDLVVGAVNNHVLTTPRHLKAAMEKQAPQFLDKLVDVVLKGVQADTRGA